MAAQITFQLQADGWAMSTARGRENWELLAIPIASLLSCFILAGQALVSFFKSKAENDASENVATRRASSRAAFLGWTRLAACLALVVVQALVPSWNLLKLLALVAYVYITLLVFLTKTASASLRPSLSRHLTLISLCAFAIYAYRDIYPLTSVTKRPKDIQESTLLWLKIALLFYLGVFLPLITPRTYNPVDPKNPQPETNPEQTASIFSLIFYQFMNPVLMLGYRNPQLSWEQLPPLCDYDDTAYLKAKSFPKLDIHTNPTSRHLFFRLLSVFSADYMLVAILIIFNVFTNFAAPVGMNRLLRYIETRGDPTGDADKWSDVRPWTWILLLWLGPIINDVVMEFEKFVLTGSLMRASAVLSQLVLEHSLRIRVKANTDGETGSTTQAKDKPSQKKATSLSGRVNTLITVDQEQIVMGREFLQLILYTPLEIALCTVFLYNILGWSALVGMALIVLFLPIPGFLVKRMRGTQVRLMKSTDERVQTVSEITSVLRMIKVFAWENQIVLRVNSKREAELKKRRTREFANLFFESVTFVLPLLVAIATYGIYTLVMKEVLLASTVYSSMLVFQMLHREMHIVGQYLSMAVNAKVSLDRLKDFLQNTELLDEFGGAPENEAREEETAIGFRDASFTWSAEASPPGSNTVFSLRVDGEVLFERGKLNLILGPTGSGKTSLLMALLGEMHRIANPNSWMNLPRAGGIAYATQESWVQNASIKDNILFGSAFDEERYSKTLDACALQRDLSLFDAGDQTEVGEKGITLSGGQKARLTLARALYSRAEILVLDDILSALDVHTAKWIVQRGLCSDLVKSRTVILVTHNIALTASIAATITVVRSDGTVHREETTADAVNSDPKLAIELDEAQDQDDTKVETTIDEDKKETKPRKDGTLIVAEEKKVGHVQWSAVKMYLTGLSSAHPVWFFTAILVGLIGMQCCQALQVWYLGYFASQYEDKDPSQVNVPYYLGVYAAILGAVLVFHSIGWIEYLYATLRASRLLHSQLLSSVLNATMGWLDVTPSSRILLRFTQDIAAVDGQLHQMLWLFVLLNIELSIKFLSIVLYVPWFLALGVVAALLGSVFGKLYNAAQLSVKREWSVSKAPALGHISDTLSSLVSVRAYGAQSYFIDESIRRLNRITKTSRTYYNLNRWLDFHLNIIGPTLAAILALYMVYFADGYLGRSSIIGFTMTMALEFATKTLWWVRIYNMFETQCNSLERIQDYMERPEHEPKPSESGKPPAPWPTSGRLQVKRLCAKYSMDRPEILHGVSFEVKAGERIGVVGRTGSGKSTLALSLLRCIFTDGEVYYDGIKTSNLNLDSLRKNIACIPQVPELLSGTLRQNLDPFDEYDDASLNSSLLAAGLFSLQNTADDGQITLDTEIAIGGRNLSVGQRQIIALSRALIRGTKLLILDEATSSIDYKTDAVIQESLRHELGQDVTLITIAHRLATCMDFDRIMVLDAGNIVEFDSPKFLLDKKGYFWSLIEESEEKEALHAMVHNGNLEN